MTTAGRRSSIDRRISRPVKRGIDVIGACLGLVALLPVVAAISVVIVAVQGRPILFRQRRPGLHGEPFTILKFRTMRRPRNGEVWYLTDNERLTRLGRFLRATSLDEIPEFCNVLRGEMSLVGPRPLLMEYLADYTPDEARRHDMRPGMTGWAVVNGRNVIEFRARLAYDVWYVDHWSLGLDLRILAMTVQQVLARTNTSITEDLALGFPLCVPQEHPIGAAGVGGDDFRATERRSNGG
jgi:lipopolysaccharide/colanic/teichoic acid biosynthesis glycosyltransferase